jgi:dynein assembly factor with WDR repeat domains 1
MESQEKLKINIYPSELEILKDNKEKITINITENFTNDSKAEAIYMNMIAQNDNLKPILEKHKDNIIIALNKLISASTINPNKEYHLEKTFQCHDMPLSKIYFNHKGNYFLTCSYDGDAMLWDRKTGSVKYKIKNHANTINSAAFTHDDKLLLTGSFDNLAMLFNAEDGIRIKTFEGHEGEIVEINFNRDENMFCSASMDLTAKIFDIELGKSIISLEGHEDVVLKASFNKDATMLLTGSYDKTCKLFDIKSGDISFDFKEHTKEISNCFFNPVDNNVIITNSLDGLCKIYDIRSGTNSLMTFDDHNKNEILCSDISSDGKFLMTGGGDNVINLYDVEKMQMINSLKGHEKEIYSVHFNYFNNGKEVKRVLSGDGKGQCRLWDVNSGECLQLFESSEDTEIISCIFNESNSDILIADVDNIVKLYTNEIPVNY